MKMIVMMVTISHNGDDGSVDGDDEDMIDNDLDGR